MFAKTLLIASLTLAAVNGRAQRPFAVQRVSSSTVGRAENNGNPYAAAGLAYINTVGSGGFCGAITKSVTYDIANGKSLIESLAGAEALYKEMWNTGKRAEEGCAIAERAWRKALGEGSNPFYAFLKANPAADVCHAAALTYIDHLFKGDDHLTSARGALAEFARELSTKPEFVPACANAVKAYLNAVEDEPAPANSAAVEAFIERAETTGLDSDQTCFQNVIAYINSVAAGDDIPTASQYFIDAASTTDAKSPCAAAAAAYAAAPPNKPVSAVKDAIYSTVNDPTNIAATVLQSFITSKDGIFDLDPVCASAVQAWFRAHLAGLNVEQTSKIVTKAFIDAAREQPDFSGTTACGKAAVAYIKNLGLEVAF